MIIILLIILALVVWYGAIQIAKLNEINKQLKQAGELIWMKKDPRHK